MTESGILLTGATGFLGGDLLTRLLAADPDVTVYCLARARDAAHLEHRREEILEWSGVGPEDQHRVVAVAGRLEEPELGLGDRQDALAAKVNEIYHTAASTRFDLPLEDARRINRDGAARVLAFARRAQDAGGMRRVHHVSTAYIAGNLPGVLAEKDVPVAPDFRNTYEQTKWEAEQLLAEARDEVPVTVYRPSIIVGDSRTGRTRHFRVLYDPIKWVYYGKTNILPCRPEVRIDVVPINYVCDAMVSIGARSDSAGEIYHLTGGAENGISIREIVDQAVDIGNRYHAEIGEPPIDPPQILSPDLAETGTPEEREKIEKLFALGRTVMRTHVPYMLIEQLFDDSHTRAALAGTGISCPPLPTYFELLCRWGAARNFGEH